MMTLRKTTWARALAVAFLATLGAALGNPQAAYAGVGQIIAVINGLFKAPISITTAPTNGQVLKFNSTMGAWEAGTDSSGSYPVAPSGGTYSTATGAAGATALGDTANASAANSTALGDGAATAGSRATAAGCFSTASATDSVAIGESASATTGTGNIAIGSDAVATGTTGAIALGDGASSTGNSSITIGQGSTDNATQRNVVIGRIAQGASAGSSAVAIGDDARATANVAVAIGTSSQGTGSLSVALGYTAIASSTGAVAIGETSSATTGTGNIAIGSDASATSAGGGTIAIGDDATSSGTAAVAIGSGALVSGTNSVSIGLNSTTTTTNAIALGSSASGTSTDSIAIGEGSGAATGTGNIAIGSDASATGATGAIAIGDGATNAQTGGIAIGVAATTTRAAQMALSMTEITLGGTTSSFPMLKRSTTSLLVNLADDSVNTGLLCGRVVSVKTQAASPYSVTITENRTVFTNEGATAGVNFTLPTAVAGYEYEFVVQDADGITITASAGDTVQIIGSVSAAAGTLTSTTIGSTVKIVSINATQWVAISVVGTWTVT